jgi:hypothetical protein
MFRYTTFNPVAKNDSPRFQFIINGDLFPLGSFIVNGDEIQKVCHRHLHRDFWDTGIEIELESCLCVFLDLVEVRVVGPSPYPCNLMPKWGDGSSNVP